MNRSFNRVLAAIFGAMLVFVSSNSLAQSAGFNSSYAVFSANGGADAYYCMQNNTSCGANPALDGAAIGTVSSLILKGAEHNVYKCGGADITSTRINYRIYPTGSPSGSYTALTIGFLSGGANGCGGEDQQWKSLTQNVNVLNGLAAGNYTIEIYSDESTTVGTQFLSNGGNNYKATFTVPNIRVNSTGGTTPNATYATLAAAVTAINGGTAHTGTITCYVSAGYTETSPAGGYSIAATGTSGNPITFIKSGTGTNPTFTAPNPAGTVGAINDAIFKIIGGDYITIDGFTMLENAANTVNTPAASNNMVEFGVALFYTTTTNGAQNNTIKNCTIDLNRNYTNTFGIYSNSTHSATNMTTLASATGTAGGNSGLTITGCSITDVNQGIVVVGPTASADANTNITIGGSLANANSITNYGTGAQLSSYITVSGTVNGILVRHCNGYTISHNTITSSNGGVTSTGNIRGIFHNGGTNAVTGTFTNNITNNTISVTGGNVANTISGIAFDATNTINASTTLNVNNNNFTSTGYSVGSATGSITFINLGTIIPLTTNINNNTFTNLTANTSGSVTFVNFAPSLTSGSTMNINGNSIVTGFNKSIAGGSVTFHTTNASSVTGSTVNINNNNLSNITVTGATSLVLINNTDYASSSSAPLKSINGNTFSTITNSTPSSSITILTDNGGASGSTVNNNIISGVTWNNSIVGLSLGSSAQSLTVAGNRINGLLSNGGGTTVKGITSATPVILISKNKIYDIENTNSSVQGIEVTAGTTTTIANNYVGDLRSPITNTVNDLLRGISITSTSTLSTIDVKYNTIYLSGSNSSAQFNTACIFATSTATSTTAALTLRNNIFVNQTTGTSGDRAAYKRSSADRTNYAAASNRNLFYGSLLYTDGGANQKANLVDYKAYVSPRDANSISELPPFLSTTGSSSNFLHIDPTVATGVESGGENSIGITDDFDGDIRFAETGYTGSGTRTDIGADEFNGTPLPNCTGTPASSTITGGTTPICSGLSGGTLALSTTYTDLGITYQWRSGTTPGGPYLTTLGTGATQAAGTLTTTTYFICEITCTNSGLTFTTGEKEIVVNPLPSVSISPSATTYCTPGGTAITLTASGANSYTWAGTGTPGLSAASGNPVTASPSTATTITVTGTDGNGCVNTSNVALTVAANPTGAAATATPATICSGFTSTLNGTANTLNANYSVASATYALQPLTGFTNGPSGDDVLSGAITLPFSFSFYGTTYSSIIINTNGQVGFDYGGTTASQQRTAQSVPSSTSPNANISLCWADLNAGSGQIKYGTNGTAPNRIFVISYSAVPFFNGTGTVSGQILLFEGSNKIQVHVTSISDNQAYSKTLGIENATGTLGTAATGRNNASWTVSTAEAWEFSPAPLTYLWTAPTNLVSPNTASTATTALTATETFTLKVSNAGCEVTTTTTVTVSSGASITTDPVATTKCAGQTATFTVSASGPGLTYQWRKGGNNLSNGGNISGADLQTLTISNVSAADADTYDVIVTATCGSPVTSAGAALTVNALPTVSVSPSSATYCNPGGTAVTLTASGANSYAWAGTGTPGLSAASGNPVTASPSTATTITVTGTDGNGCVNTATSNISIAPRVYVNSTTATPSTICSGATSSLNVVAGTTAAYTMSSTTFGLISGTGTNTATGDDALLNTVTLPFNFSFFGNVYSSILIYSNGYAAFQTGVTGTPYVQTIPDVAAPDNFIAISHDDLNVTAAGQMSYFTSGTAPNRIFVINYNGVKYYNTAANNGNLTGQIQLFEADGHIEIHVSSSTDPTLSAKSLGIENVGGTLGYSPAGRNNASYNISTPEAWKFVPSGGTLTYAWSPSTGLTPSDAVQSPTTPALTSTTGYNVSVSAAGCSASGSTTVTIGTSTITASAGTGGSISPVGEATVNCGTSPSYTITPDACYSIADVVVDNVSQGAISSYTFTNVTSGAHTIVASFTLNTNTITASAGAGGSISVNGITTVNCGTNSTTYTITPDACFSIADVLVNNSSVGAVSTYTFTNITSNQTIVASFVANPNASVASVTGASPLCIGSTATYTANTVVLSGGTGTWSSDDTNVATVDPNTGVVTAVGAGPANITFTITGGCGGTVSASQSITVSPDANAGTVTGTSPLCIGATATYSSNGDAGGTWSSGNGAIASVDPNTGLVTAIGAGTTSITYIVSTGCNTPVSASQNVTVNPNPTASISAGGPLTFCAGGSVILTSSSATTYQWNLNGSPIGGQTNQTLTVTASGNYSVIVTNSFGCFATSAETTVTVNPLAANPTATVTQPTCAVATGSITVTAPLGAGNSYTLDGGTTISWPAVTFSGVVTGQHVISVSNSFGCFSPATTTVTVDPQPFTPGTPVVTGPANVCQYVGSNTPVTYTATATGNGTQTFNWILPPNVSLVSGQGTNTLVVTFPNAAFLTQANKQLRLTVTNACGTSPLTIFYLQAQNPSTPQPIVTSSTNVCPSLGTNVPITFTIPKVAGASSYIWNAQSGTTTITHPNGLGANDTTVSVTFTNGFTTSNITVQAVNSCGTSGGRALTITRANPATPGLISGPVNVCANISPLGTTATYTVAQQPTVTSYNWTLPPGVIGLTGQGTNSVSFIFPVGYTGGTISVVASNGCGTSTARSLTVATLSPATPSVIDVIQTTACPNRVFTYSLSGMPANATTVNWTYPAGGSVVNQTAFSISISYPATSVTGTVTAQAVNNCGSSVVRSTSVFLPACPPEEKAPVYTKGNNVSAPVELFEAQVFPNPTVSDFKLRVKSLDKNSQVTVRVLDLQGRELSRMIIMPDALKTFGSNLKAGAYFVEVLQGEKRTMQKLIKL